MGILSIRKYAVPTCQHQVVKYYCILTDNKSDDKVVYLQKWQHMITSKNQKRGNKII